MSATAPRAGFSLVLFAILALALAVGAAAALIAGAAAAPTFHASGATEILFSSNLIGVAFLVVFGATLGTILWTLLSGRGARSDSRLAVTGLAAILLGVLFFVLLSVFGSGNGGFGGFGGGGPVNGGSSNNTAGSGGNLTGPGGQIAFFTFPLPSWSLFALAAGLALLVGAVALPRVAALAAVRRRERATRQPKPADVEEVRNAFAVAAHELEEGSEPREVIISLYATVLRRVGPLVGGVEWETPEEIRSLHLLQLGIRSSAAETLTRLFEEARYSSHPMGPDAVGRATEAIREARDDLDRVPLPS